MNLIWAQIKKDFILNRYLILAWLLIAFVLLGMQWNAIHLAPGNRTFGILYGTVNMATLWGGVFMLVSIFLTDPNVNSDAFCLTRPIRESRVVVAKLILALTVGLLPDLVWAVAFGVKYGGSVPLLFLDGFVVHSFVLVVVGLASLSRSYMNCIVLSICAWIGLVGIVLGVFVGERIGEQNLAWQHTSEMWRHAMTLEVYSVLIGLLGILIAFLPRTVRRRSIRVSLASLAVCALIGFAWKNIPFSLMNPIQAQVDPTGFEVSKHASIEKGVYVGRSDTRSTVLSNILKCDIENVQADNGSEVWPILLNGRLSIGDETFDPSYSIPIYRRMDTLVWNSRAIEERFGDIRFLNDAPEEEENDLSFAILDLEATKLESGKEGRYRGSVGLLTARYDRLASVPLEKGSTFEEEFCFGKVEAVRVREKQVQVRANLAMIYSKFDRKSLYWKQRIYNEGWYLARHACVILYNPVLKEALYPTDWQYVAGSKRVRNTSMMNLDLSFDRSESVSDEWLEDAELMIVVKNITRFQEEKFVVENIKF